MRLALAWLKHKKKHEQIDFDSWHSGGKGDGLASQLDGVRYFSLDELQICTDNFSESNLIANGGFGKVYKGHLINGAVVAIKRAPPGSFRGVLGFKTEIELLSRVHHKNIIRLVGFCFEQGEQMLVQEYFSKGSLHDNLYGKNSTCLDWKQRLQIALDTARGLSCLHELANPQIIHRCVSPINILLDENLNAKIISFGLSTLNREKDVDTKIIVGRFAYGDPEYLRTGKLSDKIDVYSLGVSMLELITAKCPIDEEGDSTVLKYKIMTAIDHYDQEYFGLRDMIDPRIVNQARNIGLRKFVQLALACVAKLSSDRPSMREVMKEIEIILQNDESATTTGGCDSDDSSNATISHSIEIA